ncbi:MAG: PaaI family thioesterase [Ruminococcus sp.]|nr:PaaI family thioesterase [Ruminococcus sp.]
MKMRTLEEVREIFSNDRFATENFVVIDEIWENYAKCSMHLNERHKNAMGSVMGGATFTLADFTFAVATNWQEMKTVSISSNIAYIGVAKGSRLIAEAKMIKNGRTTCYYQVSISDDLGNKVAEVTITGLHKS